MRTTRKRMHGRRRRRSPICSKSPIKEALNEDLEEMDVNPRYSNERRQEKAAAQRRGGVLGGSTSSYSTMQQAAAMAAQREDRARAAKDVSNYRRRMA